MTRPLRVGHIDLGFHDASAREVEAILRRHGYSIERSAASHEEMFRRLGCGDIDVLVSAWLPTSHGAYLAPFEEQVRKLTVLYEPYCIWACPITCQRQRSPAWATYSNPPRSSAWSG